MRPSSKQNKKRRNNLATSAKTATACTLWLINSTATTYPVKMLTSTHKDVCISKGFCFTVVCIGEKG
jgi:hypothetical protein